MTQVRLGRGFKFTALTSYPINTVPSSYRIRCSLNLGKCLTLFMYIKKIIAPDTVLLHALLVLSIRSYLIVFCCSTDFTSNRYLFLYIFWPLELERNIEQYPLIVKNRQEKYISFCKSRQTQAILSTFQRKMDNYKCNVTFSKEPPPLASDMHLKTSPLLTITLSLHKHFESRHVF